MKIRHLAMAAAAWLLAAGLAVAASAPDSKRLGHAKDLIADEQWGRAIVELQAAADDPKEANRDEALFWLAHSQHQAGDDSSSLQTISRLERTFPVSRWVKPSRSLRVEIAQRLRRDDVLWMVAAPPPPATPAAPPSVIAVRPAAAPRPPASPCADAPCVPSPVAAPPVPT